MKVNYRYSGVFRTIKFTLKTNAVTFEAAKAEGIAELHEELHDAIAQVEKIAAQIKALQAMKEEDVK